MVRTERPENPVEAGSNPNSRFDPRAPDSPRFVGVLILLAFPLWIVGSDVFGHNSIGVVPQVLAWTLALSSVREQAGADDRVPVSPGATE